MHFLMNLQGPALYLFIFVAKTVEISISTVRLVYVNKGERVKGAVLGFIEILIWLLVVCSVLNNITEDPLKIIAYAAGYSLGVYLGVAVESKVAIGLASIQVVVDAEVGNELADKLRDNGFGVTIIAGKGRDENPKNLLFIQLKMKKIPLAIKLIKENNPSAYISINDVKTTFGGFIKK